jgi:hypothetical protein
VAKSISIVARSKSGRTWTFRSITECASHFNCGAATIRQKMDSNTELNGITFQSRENIVKRKNTYKKQDNSGLVTLALAFGFVLGTVFCFMIRKFI